MRSGDCSCLAGELGGSAKENLAVNSTVIINNIKTAQLKQRDEQLLCANKPAE